MSGIRLGRDSFHTYEEGIKREWIIGNGIGGYASSTVIGAGARTYHGLLVAAPPDSPGRVLLLSSLDEEISLNEDIYPLATHKYPGTVYPEGFTYLTKFILAPAPLWVYQPGDFTVKKKIFMVHNSNTTCILYEVRCRREGALLRISPLVNARSFHGTTRSGDLSFSQKAETDGTKLESSNGFTFWLSSNLQYHADLSGIITLNMISKKIGACIQRGSFQSGYFESRLKMGTSYFFIAASTENISSLTLEKAEELYTREVYRQNLFAFNSRLTEPFALKLLRATDPFIVKHPRPVKNNNCRLSLVLRLGQGCNDLFSRVCFDPPPF